MKEPTRVQENKVVMTKLPREEFTRFQKYCEQKKETINAALRRIVMAEVDIPSKEFLSGKNVFLYNQNKDNFTWRIVLDDGSKVDVAKDLSAEYVEQLHDVLSKAVEERNAYVQKAKKESVAVPRKIMRKKR